MLNRMWKLVNDRLNYLTPTIKPIGYASSADGAADASTMPHRRRWTGHWPQGCSPRPSRPT